MSSAIAGVAPVDGVETTVMTVWPSVSAMRLLGIPVGKMMGQMLNIKVGFYIFTVGNLMALAMIPVGLALYFKRVGPFVAMRYRITNKRVIVERGLTAQEEKAIEFDRFDTIDVEVDAGDEWYKSGDLVFKQGDVERFRLEGVGRPEAFKQICWKSHRAYVGVQNALAATA